MGHSQYGAQPVRGKANTGHSKYGATISRVQSDEAPKEDITMATCASAERNPSLTDNSNYNALLQALIQGLLQVLSQGLLQSKVVNYRGV